MRISPQPVMSQPYPVPLLLPQPKSRPLSDSRGIPDTLSLFFFWKTYANFCMKCSKSAKKAEEKKLSHYKQLATSGFIVM